MGISEKTATPSALMVLGRIGRLHESFLQDGCARHGLTSTDLRVLAFLHLHGSERPTSPTLIASWIVQTSGGVTATLRRLTERGLVERRADPDDGRGKLVAITAAGLATYRTLLADLSARYAHLTDGIDLAATLDALAPLLAAYERSAGRPASSSWAGATDPAALLEPALSTFEPASHVKEPT